MYKYISINMFFTLFPLLLGDDTTAQLVYLDVCYSIKAAIACAY
jgi:hypothetical protein